MDWSFFRKMKVIAIIAVVAIGLFFMLFWGALFPTPTCFDGRKNGDEEGRDCGGSCALYCPVSMKPIRVISARSFPIADGVVHATAFLEQVNKEAGARNVAYDFRFFDADGKEIAVRSGQADIGAFGSFVITETLIEVPSIPSYTTFAIREEPRWERIPIELTYPFIVVRNIVPTSFPLGTRVTATIENNADFSFSNTAFSVLVYGTDGNVQTVSSINIPSLASGSEVPLVATWPFRFREPVSKIEIVPHSNPFTATPL